MTPDAAVHKFAHTDTSVVKYPYDAAKYGITREFVIVNTTHPGTDLDSQTTHSNLFFLDCPVHHSIVNSEVRYKIY